MSRGGLFPGPTAVRWAVLGVLIFVASPIIWQIWLEPAGAKWLDTSFWHFIGIVGFLLFVCKRASTTAAHKYRLQQMRIRESDLDTDTGPITLYLRPFSTQGNVQLSPLSSNFSLDFYFEGDALDIERLVVQALGKTRIIGGENTVVGPERILSDDHSWKQKFFSLIEMAQTVVVLPLGGTATPWEVRQLKRHHKLAKTLFIMPETNTQSAVALESKWKGFAAEVASEGILFPAYSAKGGYFKIFDANIECFDSGRWRPAYLADLVHRVVHSNEHVPLTNIAAQSALMGTIFYATLSLLNYDLLFLLAAVFATPALILSSSNYFTQSHFTFKQGLMLGFFWCALLIVCGVSDWGRMLTGHIGKCIPDKAEKLWYVLLDRAAIQKRAPLRST